MPTISMFYGILIRRFFHDTDPHHVPHIHADWELAAKGKTPFPLRVLDQ